MNSKKGKNAPAFSVSQLAKLMELFQKKHWQIDTDKDFSTFERYVTTLSNLSEEQQNFMMKISERFLHIGISQYVDELVFPLERLRKENPACCLLFAQCLPEAEKGNLKSSAMVLYQFRGNSINSLVELGKHTVCTSDIKTYLPRLKKGTFKIVLVDDYIGTGDTALAAIEYVRHVSSDELAKSDIMILCIVAMKEGVERLANEGIRVYSTHTLSKGISDYYKGEELEKATSLMSSIEAKIKVTDRCRFGYGQSEALVCMERCPNNTFPIYWLPKNAPYARR